MTFEQEIMRKVELIVGKTYDEVPCYQLIQEVLGEIPGPNSFDVNKNFMQVGDVVCFGKNNAWVSEDSCLGVYLGNGKVVTVFKDKGVVLVPWRLVHQEFIWGLRRGR